MHTISSHQTGVQRWEMSDLGVRWWVVEDIERERGEREVVATACQSAVVEGRPIQG